MRPTKRFLSNPALFGLLLLPFAIGASTARANDSAFSGVSGTPKPLKGEHRSIRMQSEKVSIDAEGKTYSTVVDFIFVNDGGATTVQMGFPESSYGDVEATKKSTFLSFASYVDGRKVTTRRIVTSGSDSEGEVEAYWVKTVAFGRHQTHKIRVAYRSPMGGTTEWGIHNALTYDFTGQNWKGKVDRSDLEVRIAKPGLWIASPKFDSKSLVMTAHVTPKETVFRKTWRDWQAQGYFMFGLTKAVPFWMMDKEVTDPQAVLTSTTFRVGAVPADLPKDAEDPHGFTRDGVTYISLSHLNRRLGYFADDLAKYKHLKVISDLDWDTKTQIATLAPGSKTLIFTPSKPAFPGSPKPVLLAGEYGSNLFVPLYAICKALGLEYTVDPGKRLFELRRGSWTGQ